MAIRIDCPSCEAPNSVDEAKRGSKVRCSKCKEPFSVPAAKKKRDDEEALQEGRKPKTKTTARMPADDDDDTRPAKKKPVAKGGFPLLPLLGCAAALVFVLLAAGGIGGYFWYRARSAANDTPIAKLDDKKDKDKEEKKQGKKEEKPDVKIDTKKEPDPKDKSPETVKPKTDTLSPELQRVKQATVQVLVLRPDGKTIEGSGFFVQSGVIVTNAHVLGMLEAKTDPPKQVEVIINGGEPSEMKIAATYTVDRAPDLAILRVDGKDLPAPLAFEDSAQVAAGQKVHISSYPFGRKERKDPTVSATEITNLKKDGAGALDEIQVGGGMSPGSSGGPVVNASGGVVGVALGQVKGTDTFLAIPTLAVQRVLDGKVGELSFDKPRPSGDKTVVPATVALIDPLQKIKEVRVEVWTGLPGAPRPYSYAPPVKSPGDSARAPQVLAKQSATAAGPITVPPSIPTGQVAWAQPVIVLTDNSTQWGVAVLIPLPASPYDRKPVNFTANFQTPKDRTVKLKYTVDVVKGKLTVIGDVDMLEIVTPVPEGGQMATAYGQINVVTDAAGQKVPADKRVLDLVRLIPTAYLLDPTSKLKKRTPRQPDMSIFKDLRDQMQNQQYQIALAYEATLVPLPNRIVQPGETWQTSHPILVRAVEKSAELQLVLVNTYEGVLTKGKRSEAIITVTGKMKATAPDFKVFEGDVSGKFGFNVDAGFISSVHLKLTSTPGSDMTSIFALDIDVDRKAGNALKIQPPSEPKSDPIAKAKNVLDKKAALTAKDPTDNPLSAAAKKKCHYKEFAIDMQAGKTYVIDLKTTAFDPFLKLGAPNGMPIAQNGGAGGDARISYRPMAAGQYRVQAISQNGKTGAFHLTVTENP